MSTGSDLSKLSHPEKDALIMTRMNAAHDLIAKLQARIDELTRPRKTPNSSILPPPKGHKANRPEVPQPPGARKGSLGRKGGGLGQLGWLLGGAGEQQARHGAQEAFGHAGDPCTAESPAIVGSACTVPLFDAVDSAGGTGHSGRAAPAGFSGRAAPAVGK